MNKIISALSTKICCSKSVVQHIFHWEYEKICGECNDHTKDWTWGKQPHDKNENQQTNLITSMDLCWHKKHTHTHNRSARRKCVLKPMWCVYAFCKRKASLNGYTAKNQSRNSATALLLSHFHSRNFSLSLILILSLLHVFMVDKSFAFAHMQFFFCRMQLGKYGNISILGHQCLCGRSSRCCYVCTI